MILEHPAGILPHVSWSGWMSVLYMAVFPSCFSYFIQQISIKSVGASKTTIFENLTPVFTIILSAVILSEAITLIKLISAGIIIAGVYINSVHNSQSKEKIQTGGQQMIRESEQKVYDVLEQLGIKYERHEHKAVYTMEELNLADLGIKGEDCKNLFIKNRKGNQNYLVIVPSAQRIDLKKLGEEVKVVGKVGRDGLGEFMINSLRAHGIDAGGISEDDEHHTSATMVIVDGQGERTFLHYPGANRGLREKDIEDSFLSGSQIVHIAGSFLMPGFDGEETARVLERAKNLGALTSLDTAWDDTGKWLSTIEPALSYIDIFLSNRDEAHHISGKTNLPDIARFFMDYGIKVVAIKMGEEGSFIMTEEEKVLVPPFSVVAVDGTGAGDAFCAGFLVGYLRGWDLYETGRFANACGAMCVRKMGATEGVGSLEETLAFIEEAEGKGNSR